jgi:HAE1 family hydrophobic/amphiphilic exporter-1
MCALYESWLYPFVIMFSVPLAVAGGFLGLWCANTGTLLTNDQPVQQFDVLTFLGFVMLVGLVVKNAILLVEQSLVYWRDQHMPIRPAIREAVRVRVRPVFMTSLTSVLGLIPLAFMPGAGSELYRGLAAVILGGMIVSTLGTFILVPAVLAMVLELRAWFGGEKFATAPALPHPADDLALGAPAVGAPVQQPSPQPATVHGASPAARAREFIGAGRGERNPRSPDNT